MTWKTAWLVSLKFNQCLFLRDGVNKLGPYEELMVIDVHPSFFVMEQRQLLMEFSQLAASNSEDKHRSRYGSSCLDIMAIYSANEIPNDNIINRLKEML